MNATEPELIIPSPQHAERLARLGRLTYEETFIGVSYYTRELVEGYTRNTFTKDRLERALLDSKSQFFLVIVDGEDAGYAQVKEREPAACLNGLHGLYLERLYIERQFKRRGIGRMLMDAVYAHARKRHFAHVWLSVWEHNPDAQAFYKAQGFREVGEWEWAFESDGQRYVDRDLIYVVELS